MTAQTLRAGILRAHAARARRRVLALVLMGLGLAACVAADVALGSTHIGFGEILQAVFAPAGADPETAIIVWSLRLPYALLAVLVGAALSLAGAEMQTVLDNPLADPFTLGVSSAASLGAALAIVTGLHLPGVPAEWSLAANTFFFAFASVLLLQAVTRTGRRGKQTMVLFGISMVFTFNALVALLQYAANPDDLQQLVFWSMGSLALSSWPKLQVLGVVLLAMLPFSLRAAARLNVLRMGEERARTLGIDTGRLRFGALLRISLLAATAVAFVGTIGFVGLVGPHIARMLIGEDHRYFLPASALAGAVLMSLASIASKAILPGVILPVGIVTAIVGVPVFLWLILRRSAQA